MEPWPHPPLHSYMGRKYRIARAYWQHTQRSFLILNLNFFFFFLLMQDDADWSTLGVKEVL
jgi:hypothetical protein